MPEYPAPNSKAIGTAREHWDKCNRENPYSGERGLIIRGVGGILETGGDHYFNQMFLLQWSVAIAHCSRLLRALMVPLVS